MDCFKHFSVMFYILQMLNYVMDLLCNLTEMWNGE